MTRETHRMNEHAGAFVRCGDDWVRADTITAVQVEWRRSGKTDEMYQVTVRSTAFGSARAYESTRGKPAAEESAEALCRLLAGEAFGGAPVRRGGS